MMVAEEVVRTRKRRCDGGRAAIYFIWVILIFSQLSLVFALLHHEESSSTPHHQNIKSPPRKARFFHSDDESLFHAPPTSAQLSEREANNPNSLYEDDKRIIHTGPNPLHN